MLILRRLLLAVALVYMPVTSVYAQPLFVQGLPELPDEEDPTAPPLDPDDLIPAKPQEGEALPEIGHDKNAAQKKAAEIDRLLSQLKRTADVKEAGKISRQIQGLWAQSGSETVDLLMQWAEDGIREQDYAKALDFVDNAIALQPEFAEGWMRRAAVHIQLNDIALAMIDLEQVLRYEPRNYNALALIGSIMEMTDRDNSAISAYEKALEIYPQMQRIQTRLGDLLEEKTDRAI